MTEMDGWMSVAVCMTGALEALRLRDSCVHAQIEPSTSVKITAGNQDNWLYDADLHA